MPTEGTLATRTRAVAATPALVAFVGSARVREEPHRAYAALRSLGPVHQSPFGFAVVTGHAEVTAALRHPDLATSEVHADMDLLRIGPLRRLLGRSDQHERGPFLTTASDLMLFRDPPSHTRLRRLVSRAFTPRTVARLEPAVAEVCDELLAPLRHRRRVDLMDAFAYPLPARVICALVGLPADDHELIARHGRHLAVAFDPLPSADELRRADDAVVALRAHLEGPIAERRERPCDDLLSDLVGVAEDGDALTADELVATLVLILIAGHETTANLIGNAVVALDDEPAARERLAHDPDVADTAVEELLRLDPPVQITQRFPTVPVELGGVELPAGSFVILGLAAANRDPAVFAAPDTVDLARDPNPHLAFGAGAHFCLGAALARLEGRIALPALYRAVPDLRVVRPVPRRRSSLTIRGFRHLPVERRP